MPFSIGTYEFSTPVVAAPMAGVSDKPYRKLCREYGASLAVSEMLTSKLELKDSTKSRFRMDLVDEAEPVCVQIVGTEPQAMAKAAQHNVDNGAQIVDINMGCPAKKVCKKAAGSALLEDELLVEKILKEVVSAVAVPVTVKIRTGSTPLTRNAVSIAKIAEEAGVEAITIHGRTRQCRFKGQAEYDTIAEVKEAVSVPIIANGDIDSPEKAAEVLDLTGADAIMIGRAAQGRPWLFSQINGFLQNGVISEPPNLGERAERIIQHISEVHQFYGERLGIRISRKHLKWYLQHWPIPILEATRLKITTTEDASEQIGLAEQFLYASLNMREAS